MTSDLDKDARGAAARAIAADTPPGQMHRAQEIADAAIRAYLNHVASHQPAPGDTQPTPAHPDDEAVDRFAALMKAKLKWEREERGRSGWQNMSAADLSRLLVEHMPKGDPVDVANFCMMLSLNGQRIVAAPAPDGLEVVGWKDERSGLFTESGIVAANWRDNIGRDPQPLVLKSAADALIAAKDAEIVRRVNWWSEQYSTAQARIRELEAEMEAGAEVIEAAADLVEAYQLDDVEAGKAAAARLLRARTALKENAGG